MSIAPDNHFQSRVCVPADFAAGVIDMWTER